MNRIAKAERLLEAAHSKINELVKFSYVVRLHSVGQVFVCIARWLRRVKGPKILKDDTLTFEPQDMLITKTQVPNIDVPGTPDESFREGLFTKTHEEKPPTLWPVSPISSFSIDMSLNASIGSFVSQLPKTLFTPDTIPQPPKKSSPKRKRKGKKSEDKAQG